MAAEEDTPFKPYRVLARKYRPKTFSQLVGQDAMVRTVTNAIQSDRLPHAFILTGVRGVGKTSTARIIARALNCVGPDGNSGPTSDPCGICPHCKAITNDRHVDVVEMDAASRTGVNDIRELIEGVRYRPIDARFKIYIIDEVHMLSSSAFNALLKTLEEPPEHVKFIFATTETRKVPVTVLSRCQRFDLRRVEVKTLTDHFNSVAEKEDVKISRRAIELIANAADGSVRDGLSLLDQAISYAGEQGSVAEEAVQEMLGLADVGMIYDLFKAVVGGAIEEALDIYNNLYNAGADPIVVLRDLLKLTHWLTRIKLSSKIANELVVSQLDRERGVELAGSMTIPILGRIWQFLLKGLDEVKGLSNSSQAVEMILIRLAYLADLPTPSDVIRKLEDNVGLTSTDNAQKQKIEKRGLYGNSSQNVDLISETGALKMTNIRPNGLIAEHIEEPKLVKPDEPPGSEFQVEAPSMPMVDDNFKSVVSMFEEKKEAVLHSVLLNQVHLVRFEAGHIAIRTEEEAPPDLAPRLSGLLTEWTGKQWLVSLSDEEGELTLREQNLRIKEAALDKARKHPLVQAVIETFPGAKVEAVVKHPTSELLDDNIQESEN